MIVVKQGLVKIVECWFGEEPTGGPDIVRHVQSNAPRGTNPRRFTTLVIDLRKEPDDILNAIKKDTRYEIRRAESKDELVWEWLQDPDPSQVREFMDFFDTFAATKGLPKICRKTIPTFAREGALALSRVSTVDGTSLVWHSYVVQARRARLLNSASLFREASDASFRNLVGRANRCLHWRDFLALKELGIRTYDFGGWYPGTEDAARLSINKFKEEFGGESEIDYSGQEALTLSGRIYMLAHDVRSRIRATRRDSASAG